MNHIPAKETEFKGVLFRSRLEARWAVYFDCCGYRWEYEPELKFRGWNYTPDFTVIGREGSGYWEIKPKRPNRDAYRKLIQLRERTGDDVFLAHGSFYQEEVPTVHQLVRVDGREYTITFSLRQKYCQLASKWRFDLV